MIRALVTVILAAATLQAGVLLGARYGQVNHEASLSGSSAKESSAQGAGFIAGYDGGNFRIVATQDVPDFKEPAKATLTALGVHLIDHEDPDIRGFLGFGAGRLSYRHSSQTLNDSPKELDLYGLEVGLILLDDRFKKTQMELGYRYFVPYGDKPQGLDFSHLSHFYIGLNFDLF